MNKNTIIGVDLSKNVIQVCTVSRNKVISNESLCASEFGHWLTQHKPSIIVFEACATSNYWVQFSRDHGHDARLISAKLVSGIRQNQKTDRNDALAVVQASQLVDVRFIMGKTFDQQELQSLMRMRELTVKHKVAIRNQIQALLLEFNIRIRPNQGGLNTVVSGVLEDAENGFSLAFREGLKLAWSAYLLAVEQIITYDKLLGKTLKSHPQCERFMALEGVSVINAVNLYIALGCGEAGSFKTGRDAAACIGLTPIQHSTGGRVRIGSIGKQVKNVPLRSYLVCGAMSFVNQTARREPRTEKERWLKALIERRGKKCAAVALANKIVRTAFAMISQDTQYKAQPLAA